MENKYLQSTENIIRNHAIQRYFYFGDRQPYQDYIKNNQEESPVTWNRIILIQAESGIFGQPYMELEHDLLQLIPEMKALPAFVNLNSYQSLVFFTEDVEDFFQIAQRFYYNLKQKYPYRFYLDVSGRFEDPAELLDVLRDMMYQIGMKYQDLYTNVFMDEKALEQYDKASQDTLHIERFADGIRTRNVPFIKKHYDFLKNKYASAKGFSAMFVKVMCTSLLESLLLDVDFCKEYSIHKDVEQLYSCSNVHSLFEVMDACINRYVGFAIKWKSDNRYRILKTREYIRENFSRRMSGEELAGIADMPLPQFITFFVEETRLSISGYTHQQRMNKAAEYLSRGSSLRDVTFMCGYKSPDYMGMCMENYYGL